jgi:hypothetical protein
MEEKVTGVQLLVWKHELTAEDEGSYERALASQKGKCLKFIREKAIDESQAVFYTSRRFVQGCRAGPGSTSGHT